MPDEIPPGPAFEPVPGPYTIRWPDYDEVRHLWDDREADETLGDAECALISSPDWQNFARVYVVVGGDPDDAGIATAKAFGALPELLAACRYTLDMLQQQVPDGHGQHETLAMRLAGSGGVRAAALLGIALTKVNAKGERP